MLSLLKDYTTVHSLSTIYANSAKDLIQLRCLFLRVVPALASPS
jgi:hypothetical protein